MKLSTFPSLSLITVIALSSPTVVAQTFSVIHTFQGNGGDGEYPHAGVTIVPGGTLYGTTSGGGYGNNGTVYQITLGNNFTVPILYFGEASESGSGSRVVFGPDHHLYGTAGRGSNGYGVVFNLVAPLTICKTASCFWKENVFWQFPGYSGDGEEPSGDLVWDQQGNIYGTTTNGGTSGHGTVYRLTGMTENVIWNFSGPPDGENPQDGVVVDGNTPPKVFGTTLGGGTYGYGTVFELMYIDGQWRESSLYDFQGGNDGKYLRAGLAMDSSGNLYGATTDGGVNGGGTVFELALANGEYTFKVLYSLPGLDGVHGGPWAALTVDSAGNNLYGTTNSDDLYILGNIFHLANMGDTWVYTSLHDFAGESDGARPISNVTIDASGNLYGTAVGAGGGVCGGGCGVVWMIKP